MQLWGEFPGCRRCSANQTWILVEQRALRVEPFMRLGLFLLRVCDLLAASILHAVRLRETRSRRSVPCPLETRAGPTTRFVRFPLGKEKGQYTASLEARTVLRMTNR